MYIVIGVLDEKASNICEVLAFYLLVRNELRFCDPKRVSKLCNSVNVFFHNVERTKANILKIGVRVPFKDK